MKAVCPPIPDLSRFLAGTLGPSAEAAVENHVESCGECQERLAGLTNDASLSGQLSAANSNSVEITDGLRRRALDAYQREAATLGQGGSTWGPGGQPPADERAEVPGYQVEEFIGRGGLGIVYRAIHRQLHRTVALKVLRRQPAPAERERLRREAAALAGLHHPNVVQIYDCGEVDGRPYLALEYVAGGTLSKYAAGKPLSPREVAGLIATLASAVGEAHRCGLIHRDIKPSNVLLVGDGLGGAGEPKLTDFGLVKRIDADSDLTLTRDLMGTPAYMAPEQAVAASEVGPACDIWALGALLYELLTGRPPFQGPTAVDTLMQVRFDDPVPPRRLQPKVPRALESICLKCLEKEPDRRYASADALAKDLANWSNGRPVSARPASIWYRVRQWCRRNPPTAVAVGLGTALVLMLAIGGPVVAVRQANLRREAEAQRQRAGENLELASQALDATIRRVYASIDIRPGVLGDFDASVALPTIPHLEVLAEQPADSPNELLRRAQARRQLAAVSHVPIKRALQLLDQALADLKPLLGTSLDESARREQALVHFTGGRRLAALQQPIGPVERGLREAVQLQECLVAERPHELMYREELANSLYLLAEQVGKVGERMVEGRALLERCVALRRQLAEESPKSRSTLFNDSLTRLRLGMVQTDLKDYAAAAETFKGGIEVQGRLIALKSDDAQFQYVLALLRQAHALALYNLGRTDEALAGMTQATDLYGKIAALFPAGGEFCRTAAQAFCLHASFLADQKDWGQSVEKARAAVSILKRLSAAHPEYRNPPVELAGARYRLAESLSRGGQGADAIAEYRAAIELASRPTGPRQVEAAKRILGDASVGLGEALLGAKDAAAALAEFDKAVASIPQNQRALLKRAHTGRANSLIALGRQAEADQAQDQARRFSGTE